MMKEILVDFSRLHLIFVIFSILSSIPKQYLKKSIITTSTNQSSWPDSAFLLDPKTRNCLLQNVLRVKTRRDDCIRKRKKEMLTD